MENIDYSIYAVKRLPESGKVGDWYILQKENNTYETYVVRPDGRLAFNKGITDLEKDKLYNSYNVVLGVDEAFYFENDQSGNKVISSNMTLYDDIFINKNDLSLNFEAVQIFGIFVNGTRLEINEYQIINSKTIKLLIPPVVGSVIVQYYKLIKNGG